MATYRKRGFSRESFGRAKQPRGVSDDGRWLSFGSAASNLVAGDTNAQADLFFREGIPMNTSSWRYTVIVILILICAPDIALASSQVDSRFTSTTAFGDPGTLSAGSGHSCSITDVGTVKCWGNNGFGQLGNGSITPSMTVVDVSGLTGATALALGSNHSCVIVAGGAVKCWGWNGNGQLGNGSTTDSQIPVAVMGLTGATALGIGFQHSCAIVTGGAVKCWGDNLDGQLGVVGQTFYPLPQNVAGSPFTSLIFVGGFESFNP